MLDNCWFSLVLGILATYRVAQFIAVDDGPFRVFGEIRAFFGRRSARDVENKVWKTLAEGVHCPFCVGVWIAGALAIALQPPLPVVWWLAVAGGQTFLEELKHDE